MKTKKENAIILAWEKLGVDFTSLEHKDENGFILYPNHQKHDYPYIKNNDL